MTNIERQEEELAAFVPEVQKKPAKPVDAQTALTLTCRRKQIVDEKGVPKFDHTRRSLTKDSIFANNNELSIAFLPKNTSVLNQQSTNRLKSVPTTKSGCTSLKPRMLGEKAEQAWREKLEQLIHRFDQHFAQPASLPLSLHQIVPVSQRSELDSRSSELEMTQKKLRDIRNSISLLQHYPPIIDEDQLNAMSDGDNSAVLGETFQTKIASQLQRHIEEVTRLECREKKLLSQISSVSKPPNASLDDDTGTQFLDRLLSKQ